LTTIAQNGPAAFSPGRKAALHYFISPSMVENLSRPAPISLLAPQACRMMAKISRQTEPEDRRSDSFS